VTVAGLLSTSPAIKGTAPAQHIDVTNEDTKGAIYYWTTSSGGKIIRYDVAHPENAPSQLFANAPIEMIDYDGSGDYYTDSLSTRCTGCHTVSPDGSKIALTLDGGGGSGTVVDIATLDELVPWNTGSNYQLYQSGGLQDSRWDSASFTPDATKLITSYYGTLTLRDVNGGSALATIPPDGSNYGDLMPSFSPDGTKLVTTHTNSGNDTSASQSSLVIRTFNNTTNSFGSPQTLLQYTNTGNNAPFFYYPSYSPDGNWIAFTTGTPNGGNSYNNSYAQTWVMKADGTLPPVRLAAADRMPHAAPLFQYPTNSWARWVPFGQTFGSTDEPMFFLTFSSRRPFGTRIPNGNQPQIWMTPFFPDRAMAGQDPSRPAFRVPFQDVTTANHIASWTTALVAQTRKTPPAPDRAAKPAPAAPPYRH
jgi:Tol biopolymer transport system component